MALLQKFLDKIRDMYNSRLTYRQPGDGSDGTCDCIGLIIGALMRLGLKWDGIHGSNYAARKQTLGLKKIGSVSELSLGDYVYKARPPGHAKYDLPSRYKPNGSYYNGDMNDYYHVGVVTSVSPFEITHMTSPTAKKDTRLDHNKNRVWSHYGKIKPLAEAGGIGSSSDAV